MDKTMKKSSRVISVSKLLLASSIALIASPSFANSVCPKESYETRIKSSDLPSFGSGDYYTTRKITFQGQEYDCLRPEELVRPLGDGGYTPPVEGGGYTLREKCGPFYAVNFDNTEMITIKSKDGSWYNFRHEYDHNRSQKSVSKCNSVNTYCNVYNVFNIPRIFKHQGISDVIAVSTITASLYKCSNPPTF